MNIKYINALKELEGKTIEEIIPIEQDGCLTGVIIQTTDEKIMELEISGDREGDAEITVEVSE